MYILSVLSLSLHLNRKIRCLRLLNQILLLLRNLLLLELLLLLNYHFLSILERQTLWQNDLLRILLLHLKRLLLHELLSSIDLELLVLLLCLHDSSCTILLNNHLGLLDKMLLNDLVSIEVVVLWLLLLRQLYKLKLLRLLWYNVAILVDVLHDLLRHQALLTCETLDHSLSCLRKLPSSLLNFRLLVLDYKDLLLLTILLLLIGIWLLLCVHYQLLRGLISRHLNLLHLLVWLLSLLLRLLLDDKPSAVKTLKLWLWHCQL